MVLDEVNYRISYRCGGIDLPREITREAFDAFVDSCDRKGTPYTLCTHVKYEARGPFVYKVQTIDLSF